MNLKRYSGGTLGLLAVGALAWGCSSKSDDCNANKSCNPFDAAGTSGTSASAGISGASGTSGRSGAGGASGTGGRAGNAGNAGATADSGAAGAPSVCDGSLAPDVDGCVISDDYGVFVSPAGNDTTGDGTEASPYATLTTALTKLDRIKRIYVCAAEYAEPSTLEIPGGVSIFGGFGCDGGVWTYDSVNNKASFKPASPIGAELNGAKGVVLQDLSITAANATSPGGSSFGITLVDSGAVLTRVEIKAGSGAVGSAGADGVNGADGADATSTQNGHPPFCSAVSTNEGATWATDSACGVRGGAGGAGYRSFAPDKGAPGGPADHVTPPNVSNGGLPASMAGAAPTAGGGAGSNGDAGSTGAAALGIGTFSAQGYAVISGGDGTDGFPGQGGGGGGASLGNNVNCTGASGGAGGMGGCGGTHATGGKGGGASVAILSWNSPLTLVNTSLLAGSAGAGGKGGRAGTGGAGKSGGQGGPGNNDNGNGVGPGGAGGFGGTGGNGGNGAGGTGGPSIAIVYSTTEPVVDTLSTLKPGIGGMPGAGGTYGNPNTKASDGSPGLVKDKYKVP